MEIVDKHGETPTPPYIKEKIKDNKRYQTVFNEIPWSVASPTAGLHLTKDLMKKLEKKMSNNRKSIITHMNRYILKSGNTKHRRTQNA